MKTTVIDFSDDAYEGLRRMAFERGTFVDNPVTQAVECCYRDDMDDIRDGLAEVQRYLADPDSAVTIDDIKARRRPGEAE